MSKRLFLHIIEKYHFLARFSMEGSKISNANHLISNASNITYIIVHQHAQHIVFAEHLGEKVENGDGGKAGGDHNAALHGRLGRDHRPNLHLRIFVKLRTAQHASVGGLV